MLNKHTIFYNNFMHFMFPISAYILLKTNFQDLYTLWGYFVLLLLAFCMFLEPQTDNLYGK